MVPPVRSAKARAQAASALALFSRIVSNSAFFFRSASMSLLFSAMTLSLSGVIAGFPLPRIAG